MDNSKLHIPQSVLKKNEKDNACKSTKKERRKKVMKFADEAKKAWGKPSVSVLICLKECLNRNKKCKICYKFSEYKGKNEEREYRIN